MRAAEELSSKRWGNVFTNTAFEAPKAFDLVFFHGFGNKIVSRNKVMNEDGMWHVFVLFITLD